MRTGFNIVKPPHYIGRTSQTSQQLRKYRTLNQRIQQESSFCYIQNRKILNTLFGQQYNTKPIKITEEQQRTLSLYFNDIPAPHKDYNSIVANLKSGAILAMRAKTDKNAPFYIFPLVAKEDYGKDPRIMGMQYRYGKLEESERVAQLDSYRKAGRSKLGHIIDTSEPDKLNFKLPKVNDRPLRMLFLSLYPDSRSDIFQSLGPNYIESYLKKNLPENSVDTLHLETSLLSDEEIKAKIEEFKPDMVGISTKTNSHGQFKKWMDYLEDTMPDTTKYIGGQLANSSYTEILNDYPNLMAMFDNGEVPTKMLVEAALNNKPEDLGKIPNLAFMKDGQPVLTEYKDYNYIVTEHSIPSDSNVKEVIDKNGIVALRMSQGCWGNCTFCTHPGKWHGSNIDNVIQVLGEWKEKYGLSSIFFTDDEVVDKDPKKAYSRLDELAQKLIDADLGITWTTDLRADCISWMDDKLMEKLKKAGCVSIFLGIESGSDTQLKRYGKMVHGVEVSAEVNKKAIEFFKNHGIKVGIGWIPFDPLMPTLRELKENIKFIEDNNLLEQNIRLDTSLRLQRGSMYTKTAGKYNMGLLGALQPNMFHYDAKYIDPRVGTIRDHLHKWTEDMQAFDDEINAIKFKLACEPAQAKRYEKQLEIGEKVQHLTLEYLKKLTEVFEETQEDEILDLINSQDENERITGYSRAKDISYMKDRRCHLIQEVNMRKLELFDITQEFKEKRDAYLAEFRQLN